MKIDTTNETTEWPRIHGDGPVVPWVASWSPEVKALVVPKLDGRGRVQRDSLNIGWLDGRPWIKPDGQGRGAPLHGMVSSWRQGLCMVEGLCQVCGRHLPDGVGVFVLTATHRRDFTENGSTFVPPVCEPCEDRSMVECPHLARLGDRALRIVGRPRPVEWQVDAPGGTRTLLPWSSRSKRYVGRNVVVAIELEGDQR